MGIEVIIAAASLATGVASLDQSRQASKRQERAQRRVQSEQRAGNAAEQARERRQQVREERIKRARVLQAAQNTGVAGSTGEFGAVAGLSTQLESNLGMNLGRAQRGDAISLFSQQAAEAGTSAQNLANLSQFFMSNAQTFGNIGGSIFKPTEIMGPPDFLKP